MCRIYCEFDANHFDYKVAKMKRLMISIEGILEDCQIVIVIDVLRSLAE